VRLVVGKAGAGGETPPLRSLALPQKTNHRTRLLRLAEENAWPPGSGRQLKSGARGGACKIYRPGLSGALAGAPGVSGYFHPPGEPGGGALVAFSGGVPDKSGYRRSHPEVAGQDDYAMLREVVKRYYGKEGQTLPDLLVVDGRPGGSINVVLTSPQRPGLTSFAGGGPGQGHRPGRPPVRDRLFFPGGKTPFLTRQCPGWLLLLRLRDETHRFAITYHRKTAEEMLHSLLNEYPASARCGGSGCSNIT